MTSVTTGPLPPRDQKHLRQILSIGSELSLRWPEVDSSQLSVLRELILKCREAESPALRRLTRHASHLVPEMSARHLIAQLVPFERLSDRALRDDEFLVWENDKKVGDLPTHVTQESDGANKIHHPTHHRGDAESRLIVIADNLRSAFNVGAIFRTAECLGIEQVILTGYTSTPDDPKTNRTSMGTHHLVPWTTWRNVNEALDSLNIDDYSIIALETVSGSTPMSDFRWPKKSVLLIGNERFGLDRRLLSRADHIVHIPVFGSKNSLNVGVAFGIAASSWRHSRIQERRNRELVTPTQKIAEPNQKRDLNGDQIGCKNEHRRNYCES